MLPGTYRLEFQGSGGPKSMYFIHSEVSISFQPSGAKTPEGMLVDSGEPFAHHREGLAYGWSCDLSVDGPRERARSWAGELVRGQENLMMRTFVVPDGSRACNDGMGSTWDLGGLPPGQYDVTASMVDVEDGGFFGGCLLGTSRVMGPVTNQTSKFKPEDGPLMFTKTVEIQHGDTIRFVGRSSRDKPKYYALPLGSDRCPEAHKILSEEECLQAVKATQLCESKQNMAASTLGFSDFPSGCSSKVR